MDGLRVMRADPADDQRDGMWHVERQRQLLEARGCCVQVEVCFANSAEPGSSPPQSYLFEANVSGDTLARPLRRDDDEA